MQTESIVIYTDGSSRGNPGPGGYGIVLMYGQHKKELSAGYRLTTNNRMELMAVIVAIESLKTNQLPIVVYSDSQYVIHSIQKGWLNTWVSTQFRGGKKNKDLWMRYYNLAKKFKIGFVWVKGHANNPWNNRCDKLATSAADGSNLLVDEWYEAELERGGGM